MAFWSRNIIAFCALENTTGWEIMNWAGEKSVWGQEGGRTITRWVRRQGKSKEGSGGERV